MLHILECQANNSGEGNKARICNCHLIEWMYMNQYLHSITYRHEGNRHCCCLNSFCLLTSLSISSFISHLWNTFVMVFTLSLNFNKESCQNGQLCSAQAIYFLLLQYFDSLEVVSFTIVSRNVNLARCMIRLWWFELKISRT